MINHDRGPLSLNEEVDSVEGFPCDLFLMEKVLYQFGFSSNSRSDSQEVACTRSLLDNISRSDILSEQLVVPSTKDLIRGCPHKMLGSVREAWVFEWTQGFPGRREGAIITELSTLSLEEIVVCRELFVESSTGVSLLSYRHQLILLLSTGHAI